MKYDFIKSKTFKQYLDENNIELTDHQKIIIIEHTGMKGYDNDKYLKDVARESSNEKVKTIVKEYFDFKDERMKRFKQLNDDEIFILEYNYDEYDRFKILPSNNFDYLYDFGLSTDGDFIISKYKFYKGEDQPVVDSYFHLMSEGRIYLDACIDFDYNFTYEFPYDYFNGTFYRIPHPFRYGDYIRDIRSGRFGVCCIENHGTEEEIKRWFNEPLTEKEKNMFDSSDIILTCEMFDDMDFCCENIEPWLLEKITEEDIPIEIRKYFIR